MSEELVADSLMNGILLDTGRAMPAAELGAISCPSDPPILVRRRHLEKRDGVSGCWRLWFDWFTGAG